MVSSTRLASALVAASLLAWSPVAPAAQRKKPAPAKIKEETPGKTAFNAGKKAYEEEKYEEAVLHYEVAYEVSKLAPILFNIAQCHRKLGDWEKAAGFYNRYLTTATPPIPNEELARQMLAEMQLKAETEKARRQQEAAKAAPPPEVPREALPVQQPPVAVEEEKSESVAGKWWLWTAVGGVVVAGTVTAIVLATNPGASRTTLGQIEF